MTPRPLTEMDRRLAEIGRRLVIPWVCMDCGGRMVATDTNPGPVCADCGHPDRRGPDSTQRRQFVSPGNRHRPGFIGRLLVAVELRLRQLENEQADGADRVAALAVMVASAQSIAGVLVLDGEATEERITALALVEKLRGESVAEFTEATAEWIEETNERIGRVETGLATALGEGLVVRAGELAERIEALEGTVDGEDLARRVQTLEKSRGAR